MSATAYQSRPDERNKLTRVLDYASETHSRALAVLLAVAFLSLLPGFFLTPPIDREEPRFAQASKQMLETGDFVDIRFQDENRYQIPVGIYWLQSFVVKTGEVLGVPRAHSKIWLYRLPSLFGAIGAVLFTYWSALAFVSRRGALLAGTMLAVCVLLGIEARLAKPDSALLLAAAAAMAAVGRIYLCSRAEPPIRAHWVIPAAFWTALAVGILVKGHFMVLLVAVPIIALSIADRNASWLKGLRPLPGILWTAALVVPWFIAIGRVSGTDYFGEAFGGGLLTRLVTGSDSSAAPPGYYYVLFWVMFWPGSVLAALAAPGLWRARTEPGVRFLIAWLVPSWIVFEIIVSKQPQYVLPLYPAIAILIAIAVERRDLSLNRWLTMGTAWWFVFPVLLVATSVFVVISAAKSIGYLSWPVGLAAATFGLFAWRLYSRAEVELSLLRGIAAALLIAIAIHGIMVPAIVTLSPSTAIARVLRDAPCIDPELAAAGFTEPSLVFLTTTDTRLTDGRGAAEFLRGGGCRYAAVDNRQLRSFLQHAEATGVRYDAIRRVESFNIARSRKVMISVFRSRQDQ